MKIRVCIPSYKRPKVETLDYLPFCRVYVDKSEYDDYVKNNHKWAKIIACDDWIQWNVARVRNHILKREFDDWADVVVLLDDDMKKIAYFKWDDEIILKAEDFERFVIKYSIMCKDLGAYYWWMNVNSDKKCYREYSPFSTLSFIWWPFQAFLKWWNLWYDENLPLKEDYDMLLQQVNKYRKILRVNAYHYVCKQSENAWGCAVMRNIERETQQFEMLRKKWGDKIVKSDTFANKKNRKFLDYNPQIHIPIRWI